MVFWFNPLRVIKEEIVCHSSRDKFQYMYFLFKTSRQLLFNHSAPFLIFICFQGTMQILNVSGNNLDSIQDLEPLRALTHFTASDNKLWDMKELARCLTSWRQLTRLDLIGNALCHKSKYRDRIIIMSPRLGKWSTADLVFKYVKACTHPWPEAEANKQEF